MKTMVDKQQIENFVDRLLDVLCNHLQAHRHLAEILEEKERAVTALKLVELDDIVEQERAIINRIGDIDTHRIELTTVIAHLIGHPEPEKLRISGIVPYVSQELASTLVEIRDELRAIAERIEMVQDRNRTLVSHSLDHIHLFLSVLSGADPDLKDYTPQGEVKETTNPAVIDRRF